MIGRIRLSDQALVVVALARRIAAPGTPTVVHLLAAAAAEPEGMAGLVLRERETAASALQTRLDSVPPGLAGLEEALGLAARKAGDRPVDTLDLAAAAVALGGADLAEVLDACGYDRQALARSLASAGDQREDPARMRETVGFPPDGRHPDLTPAAARAVAKVRAVGGGAVDVVLALAASDEEPVFTEAEAESVLAAVWRLRKRGEDRAEGFDLGLGAVLDAAAVVRSGGRATTGDLLRAALLSGGDGPARLLAEARRSG